MLSSWGKSCWCHSEERLQNQRVDCNFAGRRAPEYHDRLEEFWDTLRRAQSMLQHNWWISQIGVALCQDGHYALSIIAGAGKMKFSFVNQMPFTVWRVDDVPAAANFLMAAREQIAKRDKHLHRVTCYLALQQSGCFGDDFEAWASGPDDGHASDALQTELTAYKFLGCNLIKRRRNIFCCWPLKLHSHKF